MSRHHILFNLRRLVCVHFNEWVVVGGKFLKETVIVHLGLFINCFDMEIVAESMI